MREFRKDGKIVISYTRTVYSSCPYRLKKYMEEESYITTTPESDYGIEEHKNIENGVNMQDLSNYPALEKFTSDCDKVVAEQEYYYGDDDLHVTIHVKPDILCKKNGIVYVIDNKTSYRIDNDKYKLQLQLYAYAMSRLLGMKTAAKIYYTRYDYLTRDIIVMDKDSELDDKMINDIVRTEMVLRKIEQGKKSEPVAGIWCKQCNYILQCPLSSNEEKDLYAMSDDKLIGTILLLKRKLDLYEEELMKRVEDKGEIIERTPLGLLKAKYAVRKRNIQDKQRIYDVIKDRDDFLSFVNSFSIVKLRKLIKNGVLDPDVIKTELNTIKSIDIKIENEEKEK